MNALPSLQKASSSSRISILSAEDGFDINVVLVSELSTGDFLREGSNRWQWLLQHAKACSTSLRVFEHQHTIPGDDSTVWQSLSDSGDILLSNLFDLEVQYELTTRPWLLISYGLGGIPAKKALARLNERHYDPQYQRFLDSLGHAIFISCPHPTNANHELWSNLEDILRNELALPRKVSRMASSETVIGANICSKFVEQGLYCPVLTTYESQSVKVKTGPSLLIDSKRVLLPQKLAETYVRDEEMVCLDIERRDMSLLYCSSVSFQNIAGKLAQVFQTCVSRKGVVNAKRSVSTTALNQNMFDSTVSDHSKLGEIVSPSQSLSPANAILNSARISAGGVGSATAVDRRIACLPCFVLGPHPRNPNFTGRLEVMKQLDSVLLPRSLEGKVRDFGVTQSFALYGLGGIGKTQTALEFAYSHRHHFDAVLWVQADERTSIAESFAEMATSMGIATAQEVTDLAVSFNLMLKWLTDPRKQSKNPIDEDVPESISDASWLLIFDNADSIELLSEYWPATGSGSILITSRDPAAKDFCLGKGVELGALGQSETFNLFDKLLNEEREKPMYAEADIKQLVRRFEGVPFAAVQIASLIRRRFMTADEFVRVYDKDVRSTGLMNLHPARNDVYYHHTIFTVWLLESMDDRSHVLFGTLSLLDPFSIPEAILTKWGATRESPNYPASPEEYIQTRTNLLRSSLVSRNLQAEQLSVHPLVQEIVLAQMPKVQLEECFRLTVRMLHASLPSEDIKWGHETSHREKMAELVPHVLRLRHFFEKRKHDSPILTAEEEHKFINLVKEAGWYLYERAQHEGSLPLFLLASDMAEKYKRQNPELLADTLMCRAGLSNHVSTSEEARIIAEEHLHLRQAIVDKFSETAPEQAQCDLAMGHATVAMTLMRDIDLAKALEEINIALLMYKAIPMYEKWRRVPYYAVSHAGWILWSLGRYEEAEETLAEGIDADIKNGNPNSFGRACVLMPLGNVQSSLGKSDEAFATHLAALGGFLLTAGDSFKAGQARLKIAEHLMRRNRTSEAWEHHQLAISAFSANKFYLPELARAYIKAAHFQQLIGNILLSIELMRSAQATLDLSLPGHDVSKLSDEDMTPMIRIWSR